MDEILEAISIRLNRNRAASPAGIKHRQLADAILGLIEEGTLKAGDYLPTEAALTQRLPYSLGTVQKALRNLSELGLVKRKTGSGTVVTKRSEEMFELWQFRFANEQTGAILPAFSMVTTMEKIGQTGPWSMFLGDDACHVKITREIDVDRRFKLMNHFYLSGSRFGAIMDCQPKELEGVHMSAIIRRKFGIGTVRTKNRIVCGVFPDPICQRLGLPAGAHGIICDILGFSADSRPLSFQRVYVPAHADPMEFRELRPA